MGANLGHILVAYLGTIRPNAAEYSVSADTNFYCIGRTLIVTKHSYCKLLNKCHRN